MFRQMIKAFFIQMIIVVAIVLTSSMTFAEEIDKGFQAASEGNYKEALDAWKNLARDGDEFAQYNLGVLYQKGLGTSPDYVQAQKWYILSSWQENELAQFNRNILAKKLSPFQIIEANILAKNCLDSEYRICEDKVK